MLGSKKRERGGEEVEDLGDVALSVKMEERKRRRQREEDMKEVDAGEWSDAEVLELDSLVLQKDCENEDMDFRRMKQMSDVEDPDDDCELLFYPSKWPRGNKNVCYCFSKSVGFPSEMPFEARIICKKRGSSKYTYYIPKHTLRVRIDLVAVSNQVPTIYGRKMVIRDKQRGDLLMYVLEENPLNSEPILIQIEKTEKKKYEQLPHNITKVKRVVTAPFNETLFESGKGSVSVRGINITVRDKLPRNSKSYGNEVEKNLIWDYCYYLLFSVEVPMKDGSTRTLGALSNRIITLISTNARRTRSNIREQLHFIGHDGDESNENVDDDAESSKYVSVSGVQVPRNPDELVRDYVNISKTLCLVKNGDGIADLSDAQLKGIIAMHKKQGAHAELEKNRRKKHKELQRKRLMQQCVGTGDLPMCEHCNNLPSSVTFASCGYIYCCSAKTVIIGRICKHDTNDYCNSTP